MGANQKISSVVRRAVVEAYARGHSIAEIVQVHGVSQTTVQKYIAQSDVPRRPMGRPPGSRPTGLKPPTNQP